MGFNSGFKGLNGRFLSLDFDQFPWTVKTKKQLVMSQHISKICSTTYWRIKYTRT